MKFCAILGLQLILLIALWTSAEGTDVRDSLTLRVFNKDFAMSDEKMHKLLKEANLEGHGYLKEETTKLTKTPGSSTPDYVKTLFYYKIMPCAKAVEIEKEIDKLLKGALGSPVEQKLKKDVKTGRKIMSGRECKAGVEIHFRNQQSCHKGKGKRVKRKPCWWNCCNGCTICSGVQVLE